MFKKKVQIAFAVFLFLIVGTLVSAQTYEQGNLTFTTSCEDLNCSNNCSLSILYPNQTDLVFNQSMDLRVGFLNSSLGNLQTLGEYSYYVDCIDSQKSGTFKVTPTGEIPTTADSILYSLMLFLVLFLTAVSIYGAFAINGQNEYQMGKIMKINFNKYIKQGLFFLSYLLLTIAMFFASEISQRFFFNSFATGILVWLHKFMWIAMIPIFIIFVLFSLIKWLADLELMDLAKRNLKPYGT